MARRTAGLLALALVLGARARAQTLGVSENPVRDDRVVIYWPDSSGARVDVYAFAGPHVAGATVPAGTASWTWDLTLLPAVANGVYLVVVRVGGRVLRRRLYLERRVP